MNGKHYIELEVKNTDFNNFLNTLYQAVTIIEELYSVLQSVHYWAICPLYRENIVATINNRQINDNFTLTWNEIYKKFPNIENYFTQYHLHPYIGKTLVGNFSPHRHIYSLDSTWNLCIPGSKSIGSTVNFFSDNYYNNWENGLFDFSSTIDAVTESLSIKKDKLYMFHTECWHTLVKDSSDPTANCLLLHFKDVTSKTEAVEKSKWITI